MIFIKNNSDQTRSQATIDITLTEHPISNKREWVDLPLNLDGTVDKKQSAGFNEKDKSKKFHVVIKPGEIAKFGEGSEFNEEQGEYIYSVYGSPVFADEMGRKNFNWVIETDKDGKEITDNLQKKYREGGLYQVEFNKSNS
jgi:hypothetical protein